MLQNVVANGGSLRLTEGASAAVKLAAGRGITAVPIGIPVSVQVHAQQTILIGLAVPVIVLLPDDPATLRDDAEVVLADVLIFAVAVLRCPACSKDLAFGFLDPAVAEAKNLAL